MIDNNDEIKKTVDELCIKVFEYIYALDLSQENRKELLRCEAASFLTASIEVNSKEPKKTLDELQDAIKDVSHLCFGGLFRLFSGDNSNVKKTFYNNKKGENNNED